ncbi:MAG: hypothetical protein H6832_04200 [Planctomycetes bacterium]|nr:hypothetical protein [Planctomycetota bacterium]
MSKAAPLGAIVSALVLGSCHDGALSPSLVTSPKPFGVVRTTWGQPVALARVILIPSDAVSTTPITAADVLSGVSESYDEPLEDLVASSAASTFAQATTGADGTFTVSGVNMTRSYYPFVVVTNAQVGGQAADLFPGGTMSRVARSGNALLDMNIEVTGHPSSSATHVGSSTCLICHSDYTSQKVHAHRLGFRQPGVTGALQSLVRKSGFDAGLAFFNDATTSNFKTAGTSLWYHGYDGSRGFDKFLIATSDPTGAEIRVYLWRDTAAGKYKITMENLATPTDPDRTFVVDLTYGGAIFKQRYMLAIPDAGYAGRYAFLQYQHQGDDFNYERTRKVWRDYGMDAFWNSTSKLLRFPNKTTNIESNCMACHTTGYRYFDNVTTGERLCDGVDDAAGVFDIDGDASPDELNVGCEVCHGAGSEHIGFANARAIVSPKALSPSRETQLCGRCHDGVLGKDDRGNMQPVDSAGRMAPPGISRAEFLRDYTSRKGPSTDDLWTDAFHSKTSGQQYADFLKSAHHRNERRLVVCSDCHDQHGKGAFDGELKGDPANGAMCATCHATEINAHLLEKTGSVKLGSTTTCTSCHFSKIAKSGAGTRGKLLGMLTGGAGDANITYWQNDISSHHTVVPKKTNVGVSGKVPGTAMPVPYVNACGTCHDASNLQYSSPAIGK